MNHVGLKPGSIVNSFAPALRPGQQVLLQFPGFSPKQELMKTIFYFGSWLYYG